MRRWTLPILVLIACTFGMRQGSSPQDSRTFEFHHHIVDADLTGRGYAQTALVDLDGDGRPEYVVGRRDGPLFVYKFHSPGRWTRHRVGEDSPSDVGLTVLDVDGDGRIDLVTGGAWYRNSGDLEVPFERIVFDSELERVHDMEAADLDGTGRPGVLTQSDRNNLRWYRIPDDPRSPWIRHDIGPAVHAGLAVGDLNANGFLDVVRSTAWFENVRGNGIEWRKHPLGPTTPPPPDFQPAFAFDSTRSVVVDLNGNGRNDIVFTDAEIPGGKVWWLENVDGRGTEWLRHEIAGPGEVRRGAFHSLEVADINGNGLLDVVSAEMEWVRGESTPRWFLWENLGPSGLSWREHVILDENLGGHEIRAADVTGNGCLDIVGKPWSPHAENALGGRMFVVFLENVSAGCGPSS